jgi:hypothetical protein
MAENIEFLYPTKFGWSNMKGDAAAYMWPFCALILFFLVVIFSISTLLVALNTSQVPCFWFGKAFETLKVHPTPDIWVSSDRSFKNIRIYISNNCLNCQTDRVVGC